MDDPFARELAARDAERTRSASERDRKNMDAAAAAASYTQWLDELAPRFAQEARRRRLPGYSGGKSGSRPYRFRRCWMVGVASNETEDGYAVRRMSFFVLSDGSWRHLYGHQRRRRLSPDEIPVGLTYEEFARGFARQL